MQLLPLVAAFALFLPQPAGGDEASAETPDTGPEDIESTLDTSQERMSSFLEEILIRADALFSGNRSYDAPTGSYELTSGFDLGATAGMGWRINDRSLVSAEIGAYGQTEPEVRDTAYSVALRYRRKIYKDWLVLELRPQLILLPEEDFRRAPYFTVQFEAYFGSNYFDKNL